MGLAWKYLTMLSQHPHRGSATQYEREAADEIEQALHQMGYQTERQPFRSPRDTLYLGPAIVMLGFFIAAMIGASHPLFGLALCLLLLAPMIGELMGAMRLDFDRLLPRYPSQNILARLPQQAPTPRRTLVICGHYDTQRASPLFHPAVAPYIKGYFYIAYAGLVIILMGLVGAALRAFWPGAAWPETLLMVGAVVTLANALFLLLCRLTGRYINGANDNGSGAALVLALAERHVAAPLPGVELLFLLTGCEEVGTRGMKHFVRHTRLDPAQTRFVNLDNLGGGYLHYLMGEGMLTYHRYSAALTALAEAMAPAHSRGLYARRNLLLPTDGLIPAAAGYEAITFLACDRNGRFPDYHWYTDRLDRIDRSLLAATEEFLWRYIQRLC